MDNWKKIVVNSLFERDGNTCNLCGFTFSEIAPSDIDHVIPVAKNGKQTISNMRLVHTACHRKRNHQLKIEDLKIIGRPYIPKNILKEKIEIEFLKQVQELSKIVTKEKQISESLGLSYRQFRYLKTKYNLQGNPQYWKLEQLMSPSDANCVTQKA